MKIGLFTDTYYPHVNGVTTSVLMLKEKLESLGHRVYVFTTTDPKAPNEEMHVYRVPSIAFGGVSRLGMFYHLNLAKRIRNIGLDIIHTHTEFSLGIFGRTMARELELPLLHTYHTIYEDYVHYVVKFGALDTIAKATARKVSADFCNSVDEVIVPTVKAAELLSSYGVCRSMSIIPSGIKLGKFSGLAYPPEKLLRLRADLGIGAADKVLLYIGRLSQEKNIGEILAAMKPYMESRNDVKMLLIGEGPARRNLEDMALALNLDKRIIFAGERPWGEIGMYYQLGDVFVGASQSETQGLTYIEALASGLPVVAKADRCLEGVVENSINGYAWQEQQDFLRALDAILYDDALLERLSANARQSAEKFSDDCFASSIDALYAKVLSDRDRRKEAT